MSDGASSPHASVVADLLTLVEEPGEPVVLAWDWRMWLLALLMAGGGYAAGRDEAPGELDWREAIRRGTATAPSVVARARTAALQRATLPLLAFVLGAPISSLALAWQGQRGLASAASASSGLGAGATGLVLLVAMGLFFASVFVARPALRRWDLLWRIWSTMKSDSTPTERLLAGISRAPVPQAPSLVPASLWLADHPDDAELRRAAAAVWASGVAEVHGFAGTDDAEQQLHTVLMARAPAPVDAS